MKKKIRFTAKTFDSRSNQYFFEDEFTASFDNDSLRVFESVAQGFIPENGLVEISWNFPNQKNKIVTIYSDGTKEYSKFKVA